VHSHAHVLVLLRELKKIHSSTKGSQPHSTALQNLSRGNWIYCNPSGPKTSRHLSINLWYAPHVTKVAP